MASFQYYKDKATGEPKHTAVMLGEAGRPPSKILCFNEVIEDLQIKKPAAFLVSAQKNLFRGTASLTLIAHDYEI